MSKELIEEAERWSVSCRCKAHTGLAECYDVDTAQAMDRARTLIPELAAALRQAESERDAQHEQVLRLTVERDEATKRAARVGR